MAPARDVGLAHGEGHVVLKLCNRSRGAGVVVVPSSQLDGALLKLLGPPTGRQLKELLAPGSGVLDKTFADTLEESCPHWWSNECPLFVAERCCHSAPVQADGEDFDGTMRGSFVLYRRPCGDIADDAAGHEDPSDVLAVDWLGSYWKLPRLPCGVPGANAAEGTAADLEAARASIVSSFNSAEKLTAEVSPQHLDEVYGALTTAIPRVFRSGATGTEHLLQSYKDLEPLFCAFALARRAASVRLSKAQAAKELLEQARRLVLVASRELRDNGMTLPERAVLSYIARSEAVACAMQKAWPGAQKAAELALSHLSTNATAHYMRGLVHEEQDELGKARICMLRAVALDPDFKQPYLALAGCELRLETFGAAAGASRACLRRWPDSHTALFTLGQALYNLVFVRHGLGEQGTEMDEISQQAAVAFESCSKHVPDQWKGVHRKMLTFLAAGRARMHGLRPWMLLHAGRGLQRVAHGKVSGTLGSSSCDHCPAGNCSVSAGTTAELGCTACAPGMFSTLGASCNACPMGKFSGRLGACSCDQA
jgi:tetratricopeptide (TPR) repeat protein